MQWTEGVSMILKMPLTYYFPENQPDRVLTVRRFIAVMDLYAPGTGTQRIETKPLGIHSQNASIWLISNHEDWILF